MAARSETGGRTARALDDAPAAADAPSGNRRRRLWRYAPLLAWTCLILFASTGAGAASNTSLIVEPLARWLFPGITEARVETIHFAVRKCGHFTGYATLALLAARAFRPSSKELLRRHWLAAALIYVVSVALTDEFNQSFNPARTGTIRDSVLDTFGGLTALIVLAVLRARRARRAAQRRTI